MWPGIQGDQQYLSVSEIEYFPPSIKLDPGLLMLLWPWIIILESWEILNVPSWSWWTLDTTWWHLCPCPVVILLLHSFQGAGLASTEEMPPSQISPPLLPGLHEHDVGVEQLLSLLYLSQSSRVNCVPLSLAGQHVGGAGMIDLRQHFEQFNLLLIIRNIILQISY